MKCPCEECICLAICKQKSEIKCKILYDFVCNSDTKFKGFNSGVGLSVYDVFNKYILSTYYSDRSVCLTKWGERNGILYDKKICNDDCN